MLQAKHLWLLTAAAECIVRLLYPFPCPPTYIPVVPSSWTEFLEVRGRRKLDPVQLC